MEVLRKAILDLMRRRTKEGFFPEEVVQQIYPEDWEMFLPELYDTIIEMYQSGLMELMLDGKPAKPTIDNFEKLKIRKPSKLI